MTAKSSSRRTRSLSIDDPVEESTKTRAKSGAAVLPDSGSHASQDEFVAHSDSEEESDMQEVEVNLRVSAASRGGGTYITTKRSLSLLMTSLGAPPADTRARSLSPDDLQTSKRLRRARGTADRGEDEDEDEEDELDESDAELFAHINKLDIRPPPTPAKASRRQKLNNKGEDSESDELAEEDVRPPGTRAASSRIKGKGKAREIAPRRR
jgi:hypothetical protein